MVYFGKVKHGKIETDPGVNLPEGTVVRIEAVNGTAAPSDKADPLANLSDYVVEHDDLPADLAREHDHYIYGKPKRGK